MRIKGDPPPPAEIAAFCDRLNEITAAGGAIKLVQVYTVARQPAESFVAAAHQRGGGPNCRDRTPANATAGRRLLRLRVRSGGQGLRSKVELWKVDSTASVPVVNRFGSPVPTRDGGTGGPELPPGTPELPPVAPVPSLEPALDVHGLSWPGQVRGVFGADRVDRLLERRRRLARRRGR